MSDEQDIILADLSDEELTLQMHDDLSVSYTHLTLPTTAIV